MEKEGVERDLADKIKSATEAEISKRVAKANSENNKANKIDQNVRLSKNDLVKGVAKAVADVDSRHKTRLDTLSKLADTLVSELDSMSVNVDDFKDLGEMLRKEDANSVDKANELYKKVISFPGRTSAMKQLADTVKIIVELERKVYKLDNESLGDNKEPVKLILGKL